MFYMGDLMSELSKDIGNRIRNIRKEQGLSQEELAHRANIHPSHMGQLERGEKSPTIDSLEKIVQALNINFEALFNNSKVTENNEPRDVINMIVHKLEGRDIKEQEVAYKVLKLFFAWKDND